MNNPIVFIHYGDAEYLKYTLSAAIKFNPNKKIYLLGDSENEHYKELGIIHIKFNLFHKGKDVEDFERLFNVVKGEQLSFNKYKGNDYWIRFVFLRWFYINNFVREYSIHSFWTFDSDTLIISDLTRFEESLSKYDCTEQCSGSCMNGYVSNVSAVDKYVKHINYLFTDQEYLKKQENEFQKNKGFAFTEMRAYLSFKEQYNVETFHLSTIIDGEMFDDCLCNSEGMEMIELADGNKFKKLYKERISKALFIKKSCKEEYVMLNTLNLSWLPTYIIKKIYSEALEIENSKQANYRFKALNFKSVVLLNVATNKIRKLVKKFIKSS